VFISHTGQDGGAKTFAASILRPAMEAAGLAVCMDFVSLEPGCKWPEELVGAAANSMVVVVVLSKSYTKRFWCMLELDLALNSHLQQQEGGEAGSSLSQPLVIPVFCDSPDEVVDAASVRQHWEGGNLGERLWRDEQLGPEWAQVVDVPRWAANVFAMVGHRQNLRRKTGTTAEKDEELQLARRVVKAAVRHIPSLVDVGVEVVGFEEQEAALLAELSGRLGLWLYGQGAACWGRVVAGAQIHAGPSNCESVSVCIIAGWTTARAGASVGLVHRSLPLTMLWRQCALLIGHVDNWCRAMLDQCTPQPPNY
jgi:hypothetical protein